MNQLSFDNLVIKPSDAIEKFKSTRYKTESAIAELVDNSIQANAKNIFIIVAESKKRVTKIGILDDGIGMDTDLLKKCLRFGVGNNHIDKNGIGKFGMGLPNASVAQSDKVEVISWQNNIENAYSTYLDIDLLMEGKLGDNGQEIPEPKKIDLNNLDNVWKNNEFSPFKNKSDRSGTLVVWDRPLRAWRTFETIKNNASLVIGRLYKNFIKDNQIKVKLVLVDEKEAITIEKIDIKPNDTLFLLDKTQNPDPWNNKAPFELYNEFTIDIDQDEQNAYFKTLKNHSGQIKIKSSIISIDTFIKENSTSLGNKPIGKLADKNTGITFTRSGRAFFDQSTNLVRGRVETDRWWGIEVSFGPELDEFFGVSFDKIDFRFEDETCVNYMSMRESDYVSEHAELTESSPLEAARLDVADQLYSLVEELKREYKKRASEVKSILNRTEGEGDDDGDGNGPEKPGTDRRKKGGNTSETDEPLTTNIDDIYKSTYQKCIELGLLESTAVRIAKLAQKGKQYEIVEFEGPPNIMMDFQTNQFKNIMIIQLNRNHPAYDLIFSIIDDNLDDFEDVDTLKENFEKTSAALKLFLFSWARLEDESRKSNAFFDNESKWSAFSEFKQNFGNISKDYLGS